MGTVFKLTPAQHDKIMNDPIHYNLNIRWNDTEKMWEGQADNKTVNAIKAIVDEKSEKKQS